MDITKNQTYIIRRAFEEDMLDRFDKEIRAILAVRLLNKGLGFPGGNLHFRFGIALVCNDEVKEIICRKNTPKSTKESFRNMVNLRLAGKLSREYDGLIYEYRKYESTRGLWEGATVKLPKGLRGMIINDTIYRIFVLVDSLAGCHYESLKAMAKDIIDDHLREMQNKFEKQASPVFSKQKEMLKDQ